MSRGLALLVACMLLSACGKSTTPAGAGGLATLAASAGGFAQAVPGTSLEFPRDHGAHPRFRIEWWYLTATLEDDAGHPFGVQWTLFRTAQRLPDTDTVTDNPWQDPQVYMAHFAVTSGDTHRAFQRYARGGVHGGLARAGVTAAPFRAWLDDWYLGSADPRGSGPGAPASADGADVMSEPGSANNAWLPLRLEARQDGVAVSLRLDSERPLVLQGERGFSRKHPNGGGSYYYSHPFLQAEGVLRFGERSVRVTGQAWLDREWSSQFLQPDQSGWDWFALHLDSGEKLMLFRLRDRAGVGAGFRHGVLIAADGTRRALNPERIGFEPLEHRRIAGRNIPVRWRLTLEDSGRSLEVEALHPDQWMDVDFAYWEGYVLARGDTPETSGSGYLEMVGYPVE